ncbi:MAG: response regulator [Myxococcota bacterium]
MPHTVLLADGDTTTLELMSAVLMRNGFEVQSTNDGGDALARYFEFSPDLAIFDEDLPGLSAAQLCNQIRAQGGETHLVVLCGEDGLDDDPDALCEEYGCDAVLARPFRFGLLRGLLQRWGLEDETGKREVRTLDRVNFSVPAPEIPNLTPLSPDAAVATVEAAPSTPADGVDGGPIPIPIPIPAPELPPTVDVELEDDDGLELDIDVVVAQTHVAGDARPQPEPAEDELPEIDLEDAIITAPEPEPAEREPQEPKPTQPQPGVTNLPPGVSRTGDLGTLPLPRLLFELYIGTYTGVVRLMRKGVRRSIYFLAGLPVRVESEGLSETLGFLLRNDGRITDDQLNRAQDLVTSDGGFLGQRLVEIGALRESELLDALRDQTERKVARSLAWRDGIYEIEDDASVLQRSVVNEINPLKAIFHGIREHYDLGALLDFFSELQKLYVVAAPQFAVHFKTVAPNFQYFDTKEILNGKTTFEAALRSDDAHVLEIAQSLYFLLVVDMVHAEPEPGEPAPEIEIDRAPEAGKGLVDYAALMDAADRIAHEYLRIKGKDHFTVLQVERDADDAVIEAASQAIVESVRGDSELAGMPHDAVRRARELIQIVHRARKVLLHAGRRKRYLKKLEEADSKSSNAGDATVKSTADRRRESLIKAERAYKDGLRLLKAGDANEAYTKLNEAVHTSPAEPTYRVALAKVILVKYADRGDQALSLAYTHVEEALRLDPGNLVANIEAAKMLMGEKQNDLVRRHLERVLQRAPHHQVAQRLLEELDASEA